MTFPIDGKKHGKNHRPEKYYVQSLTLYESYMSYWSCWIMWIDIQRSEIWVFFINVWIRFRFLAFFLCHPPTLRHPSIQHGCGDVLSHHTFAHADIKRFSINPAMWNMGLRPESLSKWSAGWWLTYRKIWVRQLGWWFPRYGKIKVMFQTTNQSGTSRDWNRDSDTATELTEFWESSVANHNPNRPIGYNNLLKTKYTRNHSCAHWHW